MRHEELISDTTASGMYQQFRMFHGLDYVAFSATSLCFIPINQILITKACCSDLPTPLHPMDANGSLVVAVARIDGEPCPLPKRTLPVPFFLRQKKVFDRWLSTLCSANTSWRGIASVFTALRLFDDGAIRQLPGKPQNHDGNDTRFNKQ